MICKCGYQNEPDDLFCAQCGRKLTKRKKGAIGWIIAVVVVLGLAAGALAMWFIMGGMEPESTEPSSESTPVEDTPSQDEPDWEQGQVQVPEDRWSEDGLYYYREGELLKGLEKVDDAWYYFHPETGEKQIGWQLIDEHWFYFSEEGAAPGEGWYSDNKGWFYLEENGMHRTDRSFTDAEGNKEYSLDEEGYLVELKYYELPCYQNKDEVNGREKQIIQLQEAISGCTELKFMLTEKSLAITPMEDTALWIIQICVDGTWEMVAERPIATEEDGVFRLRFDKPVSFDAISIYEGQDHTAEPCLKDVIISYK